MQACCDGQSLSRLQAGSIGSSLGGISTNGAVRMTLNMKLLLLTNKNVLFSVIYITV